MNAAPDPLVDRRRLRRRVSVVLHRQAPARGRARRLAPRPIGAVTCAGIRSSSIPTCRPRASTGGATSRRSSAGRSARRRSTRACARPAARRHRVRVRRDRAPAQHARRASADRVGAGAAATPTTAGRAAVPRLLPRRPLRRRPRRAGGARRRGGLRRRRRRACCSSPALGADEIADAGRRACAQLGVSGVPFFIFDGRIGLSGAQEPETMRRRDRAGARGRDRCGRRVAAGHVGMRRSLERLVPRHRQADRRVDQPDHAVGLHEVAPQLAGDGIDVLGEQAVARCGRRAGARTTRAPRRGDRSPPVRSRSQNVQTMNAFAGSPKSSRST